MCIKRSMAWMLISAVVLLGSRAMVYAGEPQEKIRQTVDAVMVILRDKALQAPDKQQERRAKIRQAVLQRFGFEEMAQRSLAIHWRHLTAAQQKEFVAVFSDLLERSYIAKVERGINHQLRYTKETIDKDGYAQVQSEIVDPQGMTVDVEYRLLQRQNNWEVYDVIIEGVSMVNNYRTQFHTIITRESYDALIKKMRLKLAQEESTSISN